TRSSGSSRRSGPFEGGPTKAPTDGATAASRRARGRRKGARHLASPPGPANRANPPRRLPTVEPDVSAQIERPSRTRLEEPLTERVDGERRIVVRVEDVRNAEIRLKGHRSESQL